MPRDDRDYTKTDAPLDVRPVDRKIGTNILKGLIGSSDFFGARKQENVSAHMKKQMDRAEDISRAVRPDLEEEPE